MFSKFNIKLRALHSVFIGSFPKDLELKKHMVEIDLALKRNINVTRYMDRFVRQLELSDDKKGIEDLIFKKDGSLFEKNMIPSLSFVSRHWGHLNDSERGSVWEQTVQLLKISSMANACKSHLPIIQEIGDRIKSSNRKVTREALQSEVMSEMFKGGDISKKMLANLSKPGALKNILDNFQTIVRSTDPESKTSDMFSMLKNVLGKDQDIDAISKEIGNIKPSDITKCSGMVDVESLMKDLTPDKVGRMIGSARASAKSGTGAATTEDKSVPAEPLGANSPNHWGPSTEYLSALLNKDRSKESCLK